MFPIPSPRQPGGKQPMRLPWWVFPGEWRMALTSLWRYWRGDYR